MIYLIETGAVTRERGRAFIHFGSLETLKIEYGTCNLNPQANRN